MVSRLFPVTLQAATVRRHGKRLLGPVDLTLDGKGTSVILGPNGSGKTTLLRLLHGMERCHAGHVTWACTREEARKAQAFVFQRPVMMRRTVGDNLAYPLRLAGLGRAPALAEARIWADRVGLSARFDQPAPALSGGEQQKLAIARALITKPDLLFLDEPTASLDGRSTRDIEAILTEAIARGTCLIMATHDLGQARRLSDRVIFTLSGKIHETGPAEAFLAQPQTPEARAFLKGDIVE
jgi:tungstate transport system ATP-binding protein